MSNKPYTTTYGWILTVLLSMFNLSESVANQNIKYDASLIEGQAKKIMLGESYIREGRLDEAIEIFSIMVNSPATESEPIYFIGIAFYKMGEPLVAKEYIMSAVSLFEDNLMWRESLAKVYEALGDPGNAINEYSAILNSARATEAQRGRAKKEVKYYEATQFARQRKIRQALQLFSELVAEYPDDILILYSFGIANMLTDQLEIAATLFDRVLEIDPGYSNGYRGFLNLASVYERKKNIAKAVEILNKITMSNAPSEFLQQAEIRLNLIEVNLLVNGGNLGEALDLIQNILDIEPDNLAALTIATDIYQRTGDISEEEQIHEKIISINPERSASILRLALIYAETSRVRDAIELLERVTKKRENTADVKQARNILRQIYATDIGQLVANEIEQDKIERYSEATEQNPDDLDAYVELVSIYLQRGDIENSRANLEQIIRIDPLYIQGRKTLAAVYDELGLLSESVEQYAIAISLEMEDEMAKKLAGKLIMVNAKDLYIKGEMDLAIREFEDILSREPENALAHFYVGLIYSTRQEVIKAANEYKAVLQQAPSHISARLNLARSFEMMNREEDAIGEYQKILQANPPEDIAEIASIRLRNMERRINGLMANMGYITSYNSNTNLSDDDPEEDLISNLNFSLAYQYKMKNGIRWRFLTTPSYEIFHAGQFDFLNTSTTLSATYIPKDITYVTGYTYRTNMGLITGNGFSRSNAFFAEAFTRRKLPKIIFPFSAEKVLTGLSGRTSYTNLNAEDSPFFSAYISTVGITMNQPLGQRQALNLGYTYVKNENKEFVGSDYAYTSNGVNIGVEQGFPHSISGNINYRFTLFNYKNADSFSQFTKRRKNKQHNIVLSASRRMKNNINLFTSLSWTLNQSNLPVGFILDPEQIVLGQQSTSLSDYDRLVFSTGLNVNF